jgi:hypothetical protein
MRTDWLAQEAPWSAGFDYDEGRLGCSACYGFRTRAEAIAWLERAFDWKLCWYMMPSCWVRKR